MLPTFRSFPSTHCPPPSQAAAAAGAPLEGNQAPASPAAERLLEQAPEQAPEDEAPPSASPGSPPARPPPSFPGDRDEARHQESPICRLQCALCCCVARAVTAAYRAPPSSLSTGLTLPLPCTVAPSLPSLPSPTAQERPVGRNPLDTPDEVKRLVSGSTWARVAPASTGLLRPAQQRRPSRGGN